MVESLEEVGLEAAHFRDSLVDLELFLGFVLFDVFEDVAELVFDGVEILVVVFVPVEDFGVERGDFLFDLFDLFGLSVGNIEMEIIELIIQLLHSVRISLYIR